MPGKRCLDLVLSAAALLILAPLMVCLAVLIMIDSPGPPIYGQRRVGRLGVPFTLWKFRSMYAGSSQAIHHQASLDWFSGRPIGARYKSEKDPRVTRLGKYLRRASLDELPQLFNVIKGEMSLVGPRPMMAYERLRYEDSYFEREVVNPGVSGLWQVSGRDRLSAGEMVALDLRYVRGWSLLLDLKILANTIPAILEDARRA
jgi:lipopolysaccharide/colanic/teichoic acid biosynthesis glycosyltransferase